MKTFLKRHFFIICNLFTLWEIALAEKENFIRDAEIEDVLKSYVEPLFEAASLNPKNANIYIVNSSLVNASATFGHTMFINTGLLLKAKSAEQVVGVLAHETAHIAKGHLVHRFKKLENLSFHSLLGLIGGIALGAAGQPEAGVSLILGSSHIAERAFLHFNRSQEGAADQGAIKILEKLNWPARGLLEFMEMLSYDELLSDELKDPYVLTHPLSQIRVDFFRDYLSQNSQEKTSLPKGFEEKFQRIKTKIAAFIQTPGKTLLQYKENDKSSYARYARSIAHMKRGDLAAALENVNSLLEEFSKDAFFWDLKGQILFENGKLQEAANCYKRALELKPHIPYLRVLWAQTLLAQEDNKFLQVALTELLRAKTEEKNDPLTWRLLAVVYGKLNQSAEASLCLAELALLQGDFKEAKKQAKRSLQHHAVSTEKLRAEEIIQEVERIEEKN